MARVKKPQPTLEALFFQTPEQRVFRLLVSEPTTSFSPRIISSKLKGVRGLGGAEGILRILEDLKGLGLVEFVNNEREVRINDDNPFIAILKRVGAVCDLESLTLSLSPLCSRGVLFGLRADGLASTDSPYDVLFVTDQPDEVERIVSGHPLSRLIALKTVNESEARQLEKTNPALAQEVARGIPLFGDR